ncbi:MAG: alpha/beta fold hydrolase [Microbacteriaceae bacterium]
MPLTISQVQASQPERLVRSGTELGRNAAGLAATIERQRTILDSLRSGWQSAAADAAQDKAVPTLARMQRMHDALVRAGILLNAGGGSFHQTRAALVAAVRQLSAQGWHIEPDGSVSVRPGSMLDRYRRFSAVHDAQLRQLAATNAVTLKMMLAYFDTIDRDLSQNLRAAVAGLDAPVRGFGPGIPLPQAPPSEPRIPVGEDPDDVNRWWNALPEREREQLLRDHPDKLGNLNGIPVVVRSAANIAVLNRDIARVENATSALPPEAMTRYYSALKVREGLNANSDMTRGADTFLYLYEPEAFDGQGRAAISIGDPDVAANTTVVVPGTSHSVTSGWLSSADAANVYNETRAADRNKPVAVVAWMGYNAPDSLLDPQVAQVGNARQGGALLAADVNALEATNLGNSHVTAVGHSYGSTTVADAAAGYGMRADDVVLIGSPGTDLAESAADFNLPDGGQVFVGAAATDPVTLLGGDNNQVHIPGTGLTVGLGTDPADDDFGSTRFKAEVAGIGWPWTDHSGYLTPGSESLYSVATIAAGQGDELESEGMTAPHRSQIAIPGMPVIGLDPELLRPATDGHRHG